MKKQELEALRRLEAALLEQPPEEAPADDEIDDTWVELAGSEYDVYNTDDADVDMETYSEEVHRGSQRTPFLSFLMVVSLLLLAVSIGILLKFLGVI